MLVNVSSLLTTPFFSFSRWVWCLYHCIFRKCHACAIYRGDCGRSDWLWVLGNHSNLVLLLIRRRCIGPGELAYLLSMLSCYAVVYLYSCLHSHFPENLRGYIMFYQHKKVYWELIPFRFSLSNLKPNISYACHFCYKIHYCCSHLYQVGFGLLWTCVAKHELLKKSLKINLSGLC